MASITGQMGICVVTQTTAGTIEPTLPDGSSTVTLAAGAILGDPASGQMESGITLGFSREGRDRGYASGGFTWLGDDFLRANLATLSISFPLAGNRATLPGSPADADFVFPADVGIDAVLQACGLQDAAYSLGIGRQYTPPGAVACSVRVWDSGFMWGIKDCVGSLEISMTPGEVAIATATLSGSVEMDAGETALQAFPTFDYGVQATVSPATVESMGATWGEARGWSDMTLTIDNEIESVPDSNAEGGTRSRQTGRSITAALTIRSDSGAGAGIDYEWLNMVGDSPTDNFFGSTGTSAGLAAAVNWGFIMQGLQVTDDLTPERVGGEHVVQCNVRASSTSDGGEFFLLFS